MTLTTPSQWIYAINSSKMKNMDCKGLVFSMTGGEKLTEKNETALNDFFKDHGSKARIFCGYGMCEFGSEATANSYFASKIGSVGCPIVGVTVAAFNLDINEE